MGGAQSGGAEGGATESTPSFLPIGSVPGGTVHCRDAAFEKGAPYFFHPECKELRGKHRDADWITYVYPGPLHESPAAQLYYHDRRNVERTPGSSDDDATLQSAIASMAEESRLWAESLGLLAGGTSAGRELDAANAAGGSSVKALRVKTPNLGAAAAAAVAAKKTAATPRERVDDKRRKSAVEFEKEIAYQVDPRGLPPDV